MTALSPEASKYFQLLIDHKISDAEKELEALRQSGRATEWGKGYLKALEGLHVSEKTGDDKYLYLAKDKLEDQRAAELRKEFLTEAENIHHGDYDRGYFKALADFLTYLTEGKSVEVQPKSPQQKRLKRTKSKRVHSSRKAARKHRPVRRRK